MSEASDISWTDATWNPWQGCTKVSPACQFCTCPRPDSPRRTHRCHLEELAPALVSAGWRVILYGAAVQSDRVSV